MSKIAELAKQGVFYRPLSDTTAKPDQASKKDEQGDFSRGFDKAMLQIPQTLGGAAAYAGDVIGAEGLKQYGLGVYRNNSEKIDAISKDSDSLSNVMESDASGADWLQNTAGYVTGQALQAIVTGGVGGFIGSQLAKRGIANVVARGANSVAAKQVAQKVASRGATIGAGTALFGSNLTQEAGSIYPEALDHAAQEGRELEGGDLARVGVAATGAAAVDTAMDAIMMGRVLHGGRRLVPQTNLHVTQNGTDVVRRGGTEMVSESFGRAAMREVPAAMARETVTEGIQTGIERWGAQKELGTADAIREYVDSMGVGAVGGGMGGAASVIRANKAVPEVGPLSRAANIATEQQVLQLENDPQPLIAFPDGSVGTKAAMEMYLLQFPEGAERDGKRRELMGRDPETGKRIKPVEQEPAKSAESPEAEAQALAEWGAQHDPVPLEQAHALLAAPGMKGENMMVAPHPGGEGFTLVPSEWLTLDSQARHGELQKPAKEGAKEKANAVPAPVDNQPATVADVANAQPGAAVAAAQPGTSGAAALVDAAPGAPALTLPRVAVGDPNGWTNQNAQAARDLADRAGLTKKIEDAFAQGKTAALVRTEMKPLMRHIPEEEQTGFIVGVRATLGIPSQMDEDGKGDFQAWKASYNARKAPAAAPADPAEPEWKTNPYTAYKFVDADRAELFMTNKGVDRNLFEALEIDGKFAIKRRAVPLSPTEGTSDADDAVLPQDDGAARGAGDPVADPAGSGEAVADGAAAGQPGEVGTADAGAVATGEPDPVRATGSADTDAALSDGPAPEVDEDASGQNVRYHVTAAADKILREGFKRINTGGVGVGGTSTTGDTFTFAEKAQAQRLLDGMRKMEAIRTATNPIEEAAKITGKTEDQLRDMARQYRGDGLSEREQAIYGASFYVSYIPAASFLHDGPKRDFRVLPVDVSKGESIGGEKDGEERWEPSSVKPILREKAAPIESAPTPEEAADVPERPQVPEEAPLEAGAQGAPETSAGSASDERDDGADIPLAFIAKVRVTADVFDDETGVTAPEEVPANEALAAVRADIKNLTALLKCMKGG